MLLYHFPLTSNSATPNLTNKGLRNDYTIGGQGSFVSGGRLSSYCYKSTVSHRDSILTRISSNSNQLSICMRLYLTEANTWKDILSIGSLYNRLEIDSAKNIRFYTEDTSIRLVPHNRIVASNINSGEWYDLVLTISGEYVDLYVNGVLQSHTQQLTQLPQVLGDSENLYFFTKDGSLTKALACYAQDIRVYDYALTPQEIADYSKALVLHYQLNGNVKDCSGFGNDYTKNESKSYLFFENSPRYSKYLNTNDESIKAVTTTASTQSKCLWCKNGNDWYFLANNGQKYVNGVVSGQYDTILSNATEISDLRIYASALSQSDIQALYKTPITLGNSLNAYEFIETNEQDIKLYKSGVIKANEISESTSNQFSKNGILTTELKEI